MTSGTHATRDNTIYNTQTAPHPHWLSRVVSHGDRLGMSSIGVLESMQHSSGNVYCIDDFGVRALLCVCVLFIGGVLSGGCPTTDQRRRIGCPCYRRGARHAPQPRRRSTGHPRGVLVVHRVQVGLEGLRVRYAVFRPHLPKQHRLPPGKLLQDRLHLFGSLFGHMPRVDRSHCSQDRRVARRRPRRAQDRRRFAALPRLRSAVRSGNPTATATGVQLAVSQRVEGA